MSNIRNGGKEVYHSEQGYRLVYYPTDNQVVGYRRLYAEGQETNTFASDEYGSPQEAAAILPGLSELLLDLSQR
jgi:hypothetical protein